MNKYIELIEKFPLRPIVTESDNDKALCIVADLTQREDELDQEEMGYFAVLIELIKVFEQTKYQCDLNLSPADALRFLLEANNLKQIELCRELNLEPSHISAFLGNSHRPLGKQEIGALAARFCVSPLLFAGKDYFESPVLDMNKYRARQSGAKVAQKTSTSKPKPTGNKATPKKVTAKAASAKKKKSSPKSNKAER